MIDIHQREDKMKAKRMQTDFREFIKTIASRQPIVFHKYKGLISRFPETDRIWNVIKYDQFYEQEWALYTKGIDYDFSHTFFDNFQQLFRGVSMTNMINFFMSENCDYADVVSKGKNVYLSTFIVNGEENTVYSFGVKDECVNILNSCMVADHCENVYLSSGITKSFNIFYSKYIINSSNIRFSTNLMGCHDCIGCNNLENKTYCINNKQYTKNEYTIKKVEELKDKSAFMKRYYDLTSQAINYASQSVSGNFLVESEDIENGYFTYKIKTGRNICNVWWFEGCQNIYDVVDGWWPGLTDLYGINGVAINSEKCFLSCHVPNCSSVYYSYYLESCSYCLGCVGLKNRQFCILNKEYSKDDWFALANKIFAQMETDWLLWSFFPASVNPFYFNETIAYLIQDFDMTEVIKEWYLRSDAEINTDIPEWSQVVKTDELDQYQSVDEQWNRTINSEILKKVIQDDKGNSYRIIKMEYDFLLKYWLPLPELHWLDRIKLGFKFQ